MTGESRSPRLSFDEFKLYYESTVKITDRRLDTNRWNYSVCIAMLVAIGGTTNWGITNSAFAWVALFAGSMFSIVAILFCTLWIRQIHDFKNLNDVKFGLLNEMAPLLDFDPKTPGSVTSYLPFEKEWARLEERRAIESVEGSKLVALRSSNLELFIPKALIGVFVAVIVVLLSLAVGQQVQSAKAGPPTTTEKAR